ncbi:MAG: hypothetical protein Q4D38_13160 [Planctomycetia bacterium]|nr:hypothetical protein [Planctomycetia bacterium]
MLKKFIFTTLTIFLVLSTLSRAEEKEYKPLPFTTHTQRNEALVLKLAEMPLLTQTNEKYSLPIAILNQSDQDIACRLTFYSCDTISPIDAAQKETTRTQKDIVLPAGKTVEESFDFVLREGTYSAHYPLHVVATFEWKGEAKELHCVRVIEARVPQKSAAFAPTKVKIGGVSLLEKSCTLYRDYPGESWTLLGQNWIGSDSHSRAAFDYTQHGTSGNVRPCISAHPPYRPMGGSLYAVYPVELPREKGLTLSFGCAIREVRPPEPPSDGVTFRIWARVSGEEEKTLLDEIHTDRVDWTDRVVSLEAYAGKALDLILEMNPGPRNNTTCDGCFVSGLVINSAVGVPPVKSFDAHVRSNRFHLPLDEEFVALIYPGANGLLDARIDIGRYSDDDSFVSFNGITLAVGNQNLLTPSTIFTKPPTLRWENAECKRLVFSCEILVNDETYPIQMFVYAQNGMLVLEIPDENPRQIRSFTLREADRVAKRIYFGHGYAIEGLKRNIRIGGGGHNLAASHVGFDFENGLSLLMGASASPVAMNCDPEKKIYTLELSGATKLALVPSSRSAFEAGVKYRTQCPWIAAPTKGVERKRGRLVFDVWGGRYANNVSQLEKAFRYGVTDALFIKHVWQCWGYDVRLPDIWNTNAENPVLAHLGSFDELKALAELCDKFDVPFGLHDNYIDFYPDAESFSYDYITFHATGTPRKAWINHGAGVQSYQWRPDLFKPFLLRNMKLGREYLPTMDAYFVDVFTSMNVFDYCTRDGEFHPMSETTRHWKDCFETIGRELSHGDEPAITISEAGSDALIGSIDGADAQWILIDAEKGGAWKMFVPCEKWARTPWFAVVNHTNYSRHGAGYPDRFNALRDFSLHNTMSDDYISAEILGGLDLMVVLDTIFPGAVRKHYLAQHVVRELADKEILRVAFAKDENGVENILRQRVTWSNGWEVCVNRGEGDWKVRDFLVPKYGFVVLAPDSAADSPTAPTLLAGIVRNPNNLAEIIEFSQRLDGAFYLNGRGTSQADVLPISPSMHKAEVLDDGKKFKCSVRWECAGPAPKDLAIFVHMFEPQRGYGFTPQGWYDGGSSSIPTSQWGTDGKTEILTDVDRVYSVPEGMRDGIYHVMVGLFDAKGDGRRYALMGQTAQQMRYSVAQFQLRNGRIVGEISPVECEESMEDFLRLRANTTPAKWGAFSTLGCIYVAPSAEDANVLEVLPLPMMSEFEVAYDESLGGRVEKIQCADEEVEFRREGTKIFFRAKSHDATVYRLILDTVSKK